MNYDEARAAVRNEREGTYGQQWRTHLDRYGPKAYFYELAGILGRLEEMILRGDFRDEAHIAEVQDKLLDLGNYASFIHDWLADFRTALKDADFRRQLP